MVHSSSSPNRQEEQDKISNKKRMGAKWPAWQTRDLRHPMIARQTGACVFTKDTNSDATEWLKHIMHKVKITSMRLIFIETDLIKIDVILY